MVEMVETENVAPVCGSVSPDSGLTCQKTLYKASNGEYWDHPGGHFYSTPEIMSKLSSEHYDATSLLAGEPVAFHKPEECDYTGACAWRTREE